MVATACYIARIRGVKSAMSHVSGPQTLPGSCHHSPNMKKYSAVGKEVRAAMQALTPLVEPLSIDEAFWIYPERTVCIMLIQP